MVLADPLDLGHGKKKVRRTLYNGKAVKSLKRRIFVELEQKVVKFVLKKLKPTHYVPHLKWRGLRQEL